jgi:hypothetical protein
MSIAASLMAAAKRAIDSQREICGGVPFLWLTLKLRIYLKGFLNHRFIAKAGKDSEKCGGQKICGCAFTMAAFTLIGP